jgi:tetratricopeptide (TPR) repeat protein
MTRTGRPLPSVALTATACALVGLVACKGGDKGGDADKSPPPVAEGAEVEATPGKVAPLEAELAPPKKSAKERAGAAFDADHAKEQAEAFREHLADGRKAVKAKKYSDGIKSLEAALKIDPNHPSALAELGWAAFLSGDLDRAERFTRRAIDSSVASDRTRGAALYNLGRIHEERGDEGAALTAYTRSLRLRDNKVVAGRVAELEGKGAAVEAKECELTAMKGAPPFDLCAAAKEHFGAPSEEILGPERCDERDYTTTEVAVDAAGTKFGGEKATRIALDLGDDVRVATYGLTSDFVEGGEGGTTYLAALYSDRWYVAALGGEYNPGVGYIGESFDVTSVVADDVVPGGRPEVIVTMTWDHHDGDYGDNVIEFTKETIVAVLSVDNSGPRWLGAVKSSVVSEVGAMIEGEPSEAEESRSERKVEVVFHRDSAEYEVKAIAGHEPSAPLGRFKLGEGPALCPPQVNFAGG